MSTKNPARLTVRMPEDLEKQLKIIAINENRNVNDIAIELFNDYIKKQKDVKPE
jgi:predicted transcriptional regulator